MVPTSNYISFLFLITLLLPLQIIARDSQFFSKVPHFNNDNNNNNNNVKETVIPNKEVPVTNKPEQQPEFIPQTEENSYGLYGHESNEVPSTTPTTTTTNGAPYTTTTNYQPYKTEFEDTSKYPNNNKHNHYYNNDAYNTKFYHKDAFENDQNELSDTKYTEGYNSMENHNSNKQKYYYNNNAANEKYFYNNNNNNYNADNNRYNGEKQGMSDTRFLENGKYFYDLNYEKNNPTLYGDSSRGVNTNNWHINRGNHNGNNNNGYQNYGNNNGYQNQEEFEDEQDEFEP